jgi:phosphoglycerate dehydrogenase-like enzyme
LEKDKMNSTHNRLIAVWLTHKKVAAWNFSEAHRLRLEKALPGVRVRLCRSKEEFLAALPSATAALVWVMKQEWLAGADKLRLIVTPTAGKDFFSITLPPRISLHYSSFHGHIIAETVLGMMLCHARGLLTACRLQERNPWPLMEVCRGQRLLRGSRLTILGFGSIGTHIARLAGACGVRITAVRRSEVASPPWFGPDDRMARPEELDHILPATDHLVLCLPRSPESDNVLDARRIGLLPQQSAVYNVGRGNAVDETALAAALKDGRLGAAYLDVFREEPLAESSPLRKCPNCLIMPHAAGVAPEFMDLFIDEFLARHVGKI